MNIKIIICLISLIGTSFAQMPATGNFLLTPYTDNVCAAPSPRYPGNYLSTSTCWNMESAGSLKPLKYNSTELTFNLHNNNQMCNGNPDSTNATMKCDGTCYKSTTMSNEWATCFYVDIPQNAQFTFKHYTDNKCTNWTNIQTQAKGSDLCWPVATIFSMLPYNFNSATKNLAYLLITGNSQCTGGSENVVPSSLNCDGSCMPYGNAVTANSWLTCNYSSSGFLTYWIGLFTLLFVFA